MYWKSVFATILLCLIGTTPSFAEESTRFKDAPITLMGYHEIMHLEKQGVVEGYTDGTFRPYQRVNRAEFLKLLLTNSKRFDASLQAPIPFPDVPRDAWYAPYVAQGVKEGLIVGYPDGTFRPEESVNFAEASKMLFLVYGKPKEVEPGQPWFEPYISALYVWNIVPESLSKEAQLLNRMEVAMLIRNGDHCFYETSVKQESCYGPAAGSYYNIK